jgi:hypothetical protein
VADLELRRTAEDRRLYALEGVGTLRLEGLGGRMATAEAGTESWHITRRSRLGPAPGDARRGRPAAVEPGLLLFAAFVVRGLASDASSAAGWSTAAGT